MAKIEFKCEASMDKLRGFSRNFFDCMENDYTTDKLPDDEFNFVSGMNYAVNHFLSNFIDNLDEVEELDDSVKILHDLKKNIAGMALDAAKNSVNVEISQLITEFIDSQFIDSHEN